MAQFPLLALESESWCMRKTMTLIVAVLVASSMTAGTAVAGAPITQSFQFADVVEGVAEGCELPLRWEINGTVERKFFFDQDGNVVRIVDLVQEDNVITNLDTGEELREGPDTFVQIIDFNDDGTVTLQINGLSVLVNGGDGTVVDAGRVVLFFGPDGPSVLDVSGRHDIRGIDPLVVDDPKLLAGFCPAFS